MGNKSDIQSLARAVDSLLDAITTIDETVQEALSRISLLELRATSGVVTHSIPIYPCVTMQKSEPRPIDWSKVSPIVPVKVWDDGERLDQCFLYPKLGSGRFLASDWDNASIITGIDIAWSGGECPLPEGVEYVATLREGSKTTVVAHWDHYQPRHAGDIISFRVTGIHPDWTEEVGE